MKNRWYAVQETPDDDWDWGSYDYNEAVKMLKEQGHGLIAVIEESEYENFCLEEIQYDEVLERREMELAGELDEMIALGWTLKTFDEDFDNCDSDTWTTDDKETCRRIFTELWNNRKEA